jgi:hypothetical protein
MSPKPRRRSTARGAAIRSTPQEILFWKLAADLQKDDPRITEGTIMSGRCLRVGKEFLALVDSKESGLVVKLPLERVTDLIDAGIGQPFAPAGRVFKEWVSVPEPNRKLWRHLLEEGVKFVTAGVARTPDRNASGSRRE